MQIRTTIELSKEHRDFLDTLPYGHLKLFISELIDCARKTCNEMGEKQALAFLNAGMFELRLKNKKDKEVDDG